jgi:hypothetical protein
MPFAEVSLQDKEDGYSENRMGSHFVGVLRLCLAAAVLYAIMVLISGISQPLMDLPSFRQTQTALSVYWLVHGSHWLAYETPVLGAPWPVPFEFPLYQWIVAVLVKVGAPIDPAGRLVSFIFYVATLWPMHVFFRAARLGRIASLSTAILFMTAPLYLYYSRTFMIESCALFFSVLALAFVAQYLWKRRLSSAIIAAAAGSAAILTKSTTFPAFATVATCLIAIEFSRYVWPRMNRAELRNVIAPIAALAIPFVIGVLWVYYSDQLKMNNEFGRMLTSAALQHWNFGDNGQRLSAALWHDVVYVRVLRELFGYGVPLALVVIGTGLARLRSSVATAIAAFGFVIPFLVFTGLHFVHGYYQYANGIFALAAVGIGIGSVAKGRQFLLAGALLLALVLGQIAIFRTYRHKIKADLSQNDRLRAAEFVRKTTPADSAVLVFGDDWASHIPYYSRRKALVVPNWTPSPLVDRILAEPAAFLGNLKLGCVVLCRDGIKRYGDRSAPIEKFTAGREIKGEFGTCQVIAP